VSRTDHEPPPALATPPARRPASAARWALLSSLCLALACGSSDDRPSSEGAAAVHTALEDAQRMTAKVEMRRLAEAFMLWQVHNAGADCPGGFADLEQYLSRSEWSDPWGNDYVLLCGDDRPAGVEGFAALSKGPDGVRGTADDVTSWE
jgi:hypothetical protein